MLTRLKSLAFDPLRRRIETFFRLDTMEEKETKAHVEHHLNIAGGKHPIFPDDILTQIHEHAKGVPALINTLCSNCLLDITYEQKKLVDMESFKRSVAELF